MIIKQEPYFSYYEIIIENNLKNAFLDYLKKYLNFTEKDIEFSGGIEICGDIWGGEFIEEYKIADNFIEFEEENY